MGSSWPLGSWGFLGCVCKARVAIGVSVPDSSGCGEVDRGRMAGLNGTVLDLDLADLAIASGFLLSLTVTR